MTDPSQLMPESGLPPASSLTGSDRDAGGDRSGSYDHEFATIRRLRRAWREGVEGGGYQPAETVFAQLSARYETPRRGA